MKEAPIHIVSLLGRLGNQMFQYAFWLSLKSKYPEHIGYLYPLYGENDLVRLFGIPQDIVLSWEDVERLQSNLLPNQINNIREQGCQFQMVDMDGALLTLYNGYWQTERYFSGIVDEVRKTFVFPTDLLNEKTKRLATILKTQEAVSVHIRRGDYFSPENNMVYGTCCSVDYYSEAIALMREQVPSASCFYLFSDEPDWVKANFRLENSVVVDWNQGEEYWQDMYLMSLCRHHIIANSTFSWWGAWLDDRLDKIAIAPHRWFNNRFTPDILPANWLHVYPQNYQRHQLIELLENGTIRPKGDGLFDGKMGYVLFLYQYSRYTEDSFYERVAENMLDVVLNHLYSKESIEYGNGLAGIGYGIEYLIRNGFVEGDADDVLAELDDSLVRRFTECEDLSLEHGLSGIIRYFRFRLEGKEESAQSKVNRKRLDTICDYANTFGILNHP